jgi:hypothetical protein
MIGVVEQGGAIPGLRYRGAVESTARTLGTYNNSWNENFHWRFHVSYITGSHALKVGTNDAWAYHENTTYVPNPLSYRFNNGVPQRDRPARAADHRQEQHRPRLRAVRPGQVDDQPVDGVGRHPLRPPCEPLPEQSLGPTYATPTRNLTFPEQDNLNWQDITPKSQAAYDLFGNGKTALKVSLNKVSGGPGTTNANAGYPGVDWQQSDQRLEHGRSAQLDRRNRNYVPDCDLLNKASRTTWGPAGTSARRSTTRRSDCRRRIPVSIPTS